MSGRYGRRKLPRNELGGSPDTFALNDDFAGLKKDFQRDFTVRIPLDMFGANLL